MFLFLFFHILIQGLNAHQFDSIEIIHQGDFSTSNSSQESDIFSMADRLYNQRSTDGTKVFEAIKLYRSQLKAPAIANMHHYIQLARMEFYAGHFVEGLTTSKSLEYFQSSLRNALDAARILHDDLGSFPELNQVQGLRYAQAIYVYSMSLSQWARLKGTLTILNRWPEIRDINQSLIDHAFGHIDYYGPYRIIGLAHNEMPPIAGGNPEIAREYLSKAFEGTLTEDGFSSHVYNNIALATRLLKDDQKERACYIVNKSRFMFERDYQRVAPDRVPESLAEKKILMKMWLKNRCHDFENQTR